MQAKPKKSGGSALNDLVDLNFGGPAASVVSPNPPQRTAASLDPWSPVGGAGGAGQTNTNKPAVFVGLDSPPGLVTGPGLSHKAASSQQTRVHQSAALCSSQSSL